MKRHGKKGTSKKIYKQVGCAKRMRQKGGSAGDGAPVLFSRTMYPYDTTGGAANPMDARQTMTGGRKSRRYSRKYYKQSGGAYNLLVGPANYADQPINEKYTETNPFRT